MEAKQVKSFLCNFSPRLVLILTLYSPHAAFLDGNAPDRLCAPIKQYVESKGGQVLLCSPILEIITDSKSASVRGLRLKNNTVITADEYVSAVPVDVFKKILPFDWSAMPFFRQLDELEGIPVMNVQIWFDKKLPSVDGLVFSRSPLLSGLFNPKHLKMIINVFFFECTAIH